MNLSPDVRREEAGSLNSKVRIAKQTIYSTTYSNVGDEFLDSLTKELAATLDVQTVLIQRLLTLNEYRDLKENDGCPSIQIIDDTSCNTSRENSPSDTENNTEKARFLYIKASSSTLTSTSLAKHSAVSLSLLEESPQLKTLKHATYYVTQDASLSSSNTIYPEYSSFVGLRLDSQQTKGVDSNNKKGTTPIGIITVMDNKPMNKERVIFIQGILASVELRAKNEIERIRQGEHLIIAKNAALKDAENKIKFLADMSHEIRTPMNAVIALTDLLLQERSSLNEEQTEHLEVIQTSGNHLLTVINDILDISKINHDPKFKLEERRFNLRKCIKDTLNMARHQASMTQHNKIVCVSECPADVNDDIPLPQLIPKLEKMGTLPLPVPHYLGKTVLPLLWKIDPNVPEHLMGDTMRLTQIILNLCSNAVKFTRKGGIYVKISKYVPRQSKNTSDQPEWTSFKQRYDAKVEEIYARAMHGDKTMNMLSFSAGATDNGHKNEDNMPDKEGGEDNSSTPEKVVLEISVTDTGIGMPADRLPRLFKSFSQIDISTARRYGGTGLGLAISSMLVNRMDGGLWVESEEGVGSRFSSALPLIISSDRGEDGKENESTHSSNIIASPPSPSSTTSDGSVSLGSSIYSDRVLSEVPSSNLFSPSSSPNNGFLSSCNQISNSQQDTKPNKENDSLASDSLKVGLSVYTTTPTTAHSSWEPIMNRIPPSEPYSAENNNSELQNMISKYNKDPNSPSTYLFNTNSTPNSNTNHNNNILSKSSLEMPPVTSRVPRVTISKQSHYGRKPSHSKEENLALTYPVKIMLAEDNVLNQKIAISILKRLGYQDVIIASNGREALDLMRKHKFDIIFMDLYMPEMDGLEVTRYIMSERKQESISSQDNPLLNVNDVYIIALTASASRQDRQICIDAGMNDFISKPFTLMEMTAALKNCASKRKKRKKQQIREEECSKQHEHQQHELQDYPMIYVDNDRKSNNRSRSNSVEVESVDDPMSTSLENTPTASSAGFFQL